MSISDFVADLGFEPDRFQVEAFDAVDNGNNVIVAAPTGAGKTLVAAYAVERAISQGQRVFYTTPIKALSNQKFLELAERLGPDQVGLLTGDNAINGDAPVVVMTTEVLRNMIYAGSQLIGLITVVLDEVHYLQDVYRGPVWEEVIIHLPHRVQLVCLSATVSNASELRDWIETVRGPCELVVETRRPVELENLYLVAERGGPTQHLLKVSQGGKPNPKGFRFDAEIGRANRHKRRRDGQKRYKTPSRPQVIKALADRQLLPAIYFIFSRNGCDEAARQIGGSGAVLTSDVERRRIDEILEHHSEGLDAADFEVLGYESFANALRSGVAAHHAGMVPPLKEAVEQAFTEGLIKVVFATETLALGVNMPARTVVIDKLTKYNGEGHEFLTPAQFTQLTGRAGRRGIDRHGTAVILWSPWVKFDQVAALANSRNFLLTSSFRPTYNMAANLVRRHEPDEARHLLNLSFAQFRADAAVVRSEGGVDKLRSRRAQLAGRLERDFGPEDELRAAVATQPALDRAEIGFALSRAQPGDVLTIQGQELPSPVAVLSVAYRGGKEDSRVKVVVCDTDGDTYELDAADLDEPPLVAGQIAMPEPYLPNSVAFVHEVSTMLGRTRLASPKKRKSLAPTTAIQSTSDVSHGARKALRRLDRLDSEIAELKSRRQSDAETLARQFDRVIDLLTERHHLVDWTLTPSGQRLARLYHESDLALVEALDDGVFDGLNPAELAGLASVFCYDERRSDAPGPPTYPSPVLNRRFGRITKLLADLNRAERRHQLPETKPVDPGFLAIAHAWAAGGNLDAVLDREDLSAGDFVRTAKQIVDLLRQLAILAPDPNTAEAAGEAAAGVHRDLVAASSSLGADPP